MSFPVFIPPALQEFKQDITVSTSLKSLKVNEAMTLPVTVKNISREKWHTYDNAVGKNHVHLLYYWIDESGNSIIKNGGYLKEDLSPGDSEVINAEITAPDSAGKYTLRFTMAQEDVGGIFINNGATPLDISVSIN